LIVLFRQFGLFLLFLIAMVSTAFALESISYVDFHYNVSTRALHNFLPPHYSLETPVGLVDLNADGIAEMIVQKCEENSSICLHSIWAEQEKNYIELATIAAMRLHLGRNRHHGVQNILAYDDPRNDYNATVYVWDPINSRYIKE